MHKRSDKRIAFGFIVIESLEWYPGYNLVSELKILTVL